MLHLYHIQVDIIDLLTKSVVFVSYSGWDIIDSCYIWVDTIDLFNKCVAFVSNLWNPFDQLLNENLLIYPLNPRYMNLLVVDLLLLIFFDILWSIICDIEICFNFEWLIVMQSLISSEFCINFKFSFFGFSQFKSIWLILKFVFFFSLDKIR